MGGHEMDPVIAQMLSEMVSTMIDRDDTYLYEQKFFSRPFDWDPIVKKWAAENPGLLEG